MRGFAVRNFERLMIGYYGCTLMYANMYCEKDLDRRYGRV